MFYDWPRKYVGADSDFFNFSTFIHDYEYAYFGTFYEHLPNLFSWSNSELPYLELQDNFDPIRDATSSTETLPFENASPDSALNDISETTSYDPPPQTAFSAELSVFTRPSKASGTINPKEDQLA